MDESPDLSKAIEKVQQMLSDENGQNQIQNILSMFAGTGDDREDDNSSESSPSFGESASSFDTSDLEMLMKMKNVMSAMNDMKNSSQTNFLLALKPFLKKERRNKVEQAVKLISAARVFKAFKDMNEGGG